MPGFVTHYLFGVKTYHTLEDEELKTVLKNNKRVFSLGLQGPDFFFFYMPLAVSISPNIGSTIHKKDTNDKPLQGAEFTLYLDEQCQQEIAKGVTDENGILRFQALYAIVSYYVKETKPPVGYRSPIDENGEQQRYEIYEEGMPQDGEVHLDIVNEIDFVLPNTGAPAPLYTNLAGIALCAISMRFIKRKTKRRNIT